MHIALLQAKRWHKELNTKYNENTKDNFKNCSTQDLAKLPEYQLLRVEFGKRILQGYFLTKQTAVT